MIAVALVLCAVFVPCAFIGGITGQFFRQFAVTIAVSTVISAFNSLTLSPGIGCDSAQAARRATRDPLTWLLDVTLGLVLPAVQLAFDARTGAVRRIVGCLLRVSLIVPCSSMAACWC